MKRISISSLAQVLLVSGGCAAAGCGGSPPPPSTAQTETAQETPVDAPAAAEATAEIRTADASLPPAPPVVPDTPSFGPRRQPILQTAGERKVRDDYDDEALKTGDDDEEENNVKPGSPEALLREMARLRSAPLDVV